MPGSKPNLFFRNKQGKFELDAQKALAVSTRGTGMLFADLDNDGDLDLARLVQTPWHLGRRTGNDNARAGSGA